MGPGSSRAPEPRSLHPLDCRLTESENLPPSLFRREEATYSSHLHSPVWKTVVNLDPWLLDLSAPWAGACRLILQLMAAHPAFRRKDTRWPGKAWLGLWTQQSQVEVGWGLGGLISDFWFHYKTLFLTRIEYHLKSARKTNQQKNQKKKKRNTAT